LIERYQEEQIILTKSQYGVKFPLIFEEDRMVANGMVLVAETTTKGVCSTTRAIRRKLIVVPRVVYVASLSPSSFPPNHKTPKLRTNTPPQVGGTFSNTTSSDNTDTPARAPINPNNNPAGTFDNDSNAPRAGYDNNVDSNIDGGEGGKKKGLMSKVKDAFVPKPGSIGRDDGLVSFFLSPVLFSNLWFVESLGWRGEDIGRSRGLMRSRLVMMLRAFILRGREGDMSRRIGI
jgi:hypothetical protein